MTGRRWSLAIWALAALVAAGVSASLLAIPVQTTDSLIPILQALDHRSALGALLSSADAAAYLRPLRMAQIQWLVNISGGHFYGVFKSVHVALVLACIGLFVMAADVRTRRDAAATSFGLAVLTGMSTFLGTVWEAYPINHFLEIVVACLAVFVLAQQRPGLLVDLAILAIFGAAALTLESGLLVWVVIAGGWLTGMPGISRRGALLATALLLAYLVLRFGYLGTGLPTLVERSTGFGLRTLDPPELLARFGRNPLPLYLYNIVSALGAVTIAQPRAGVWTLPAALQNGQPYLGTLINIVSSGLTTALIGWSLTSRVRAWRARPFEPGDQVLVVAVAMLVANAVLSYGYTKDEILSPAGVFYALAAVVALRDLLTRLDVRLTTGAPAAVVVGLALLVAPVSGGWGLRALGLHYRCQQMALDVRNEWVEVDRWLERQQATPTTDEGRAVVRALRREALDHATANPYWLALQGTVLFQ